MERETEMKHHVDAHVGKRIRHRRWMVGKTQDQLADKVGIRFQQIQKYETGMNRVSASRLWDIALALGVSTSFFFEGLDGSIESDSGMFDKTTTAVAKDFSDLNDAQKAAVIQVIDSYKHQPPFLKQATG